MGRSNDRVGQVGRAGDLPLVLVHSRRSRIRTANRASALTTVETVRTMVMVTVFMAIRSLSCWRSVADVVLAVSPVGFGHWAGARRRR